MPVFEHAVFGNCNGSHQLLVSSLNGEEPLLEQLRFMVDRPAGHVGPEVVWSPCWGCGPLRDWWAVWRAEEDRSAPRRNMVRSEVVLIRQVDVESVGDAEEFLRFLTADSTRNLPPQIGPIVSLLSAGVRPVVIPDVFSVPGIIAELWPRLWPAARRCLAVRTLFETESLQSWGGALPHIVFIPTELRPRWRSHRLVEDDGMSRDSSIWLSGDGAPELDRLIKENWAWLPGDFQVIARFERIAQSLRSLRKERGQLADALLVLRTADALGEGFRLPEEDLDLLKSYVSDMGSATVTDVRSASLVNLGLIGAPGSDFETALSRWIQERLPLQPDVDSLWVLEQQAGNNHAEWWLRGARTGLASALTDMTSDWARAMWRWWTLNPEAVAWIKGLLGSDPGTEQSLLAHVPSQLDNHLEPEIRSLCAERQWARLLAGILRTRTHLDEGLEVLRHTLGCPELGLGILLENRDATEIVSAAIYSAWTPLIERAAQLTAQDVALLDGMPPHAPGYIPLLSRHLSFHGKVPPATRTQRFIFGLLDGCLDQNEDCINIVVQLYLDVAEEILAYQHQEAIWSAVDSERRELILSATSSAWLDRWVSGRQPSRPGPVLAEAVRNGARTALHGVWIGLIIEFLLAFPEVTEKEAVDWLESGEFTWRANDDKSLAQLLTDRKWSYAVQRLIRSPRGELRAVAWHAQSLLLPWDRPWIPRLGKGSVVGVRNWLTGKVGPRIKVLLLAANPTTSTQLAIDEEVRVIQQKVRESRFRDAVDVCSRWAVRPDDLQQALLEELPTIVHFSGHGGGPDGIVLHSDGPEGERWVSSEALAHLFRTLKDNIRVVVLNACYSAEQASRIVEEIDFVVGMKDPIGDDAAREFAAAFYRGLAFGRTIQNAFDLGIGQLKLMGLKDDEDVPVLMTRKGIDAGSVILVQPT